MIDETYQVQHTQDLATLQNWQREDAPTSVCVTKPVVVGDVVTEHYFLKSCRIQDDLLLTLILNI